MASGLPHARGVPAIANMAAHAATRKAQAAMNADILESVETDGTALFFFPPTKRTIMNEVRNERNELNAPSGSIIYLEYYENYNKHNRPNNYRRVC